MVLEEAGGGSFYRRASGVDRGSAGDTWTLRPVTSGVSERGRRRRSSRGDCGRTGTNTGSRGRRRAQCRAHCGVGRTAPVLAAASSGVGECQGELRGLGCRWWRGLARFGSRGSEHARNRALGGTQSASTRMPAPLDERGHRVDYDIRSTNVQRPCLACCSWWF